MTDLKDMSIEMLDDAIDDAVHDEEGSSMSLARSALDELVRRYRELEAKLSDIAWLHTHSSKLSLDLAAKDAECKAKVIEALEEAKEIAENYLSNHDDVIICEIRALIEKRKGEGK